MSKNVHQIYIKNNLKIEGTIMFLLVSYIFLICAFLFEYICGDQVQSGKYSYSLYTLTHHPNTK